MKKAILILAVISITMPAIAAEPLLLEPLSPSAATQAAPSVNADPNSVQVSFPGSTYSGTYDSNMVPQNAVAEGKPAPEKQLPKVRIRTKQRSQGNSYWNAGGKGTKSFF